MYIYIHQTECAHTLGDEMENNFITVACKISVRLKMSKNCKNGLRLAKDRVKCSLPRFLWTTVLIPEFLKKEAPSACADADLSLDIHETITMTYSAMTHKYALIVPRLFGVASQDQKDSDLAYLLPLIDVTDQTR